MSGLSLLQALAETVPALRSRPKGRDAVEHVLERFARRAELPCLILLDLCRRGSTEEDTAAVRGGSSTGAPEAPSKLDTAETTELCSLVESGDEEALLSLASKLLGEPFSVTCVVHGSRGAIGVLAASLPAPVQGVAELRAALEVLASALAPELDPFSADPAQRQSRKMLTLVIENIPQHIFWKDRGGRYLGCNRNFALVAGVGDPREIVGKNDFELAWSREESEFFRECDRRVMDNDAAEYHIIEPQHQAGGRNAWLDTNKIPLHDDEGRVIGVLGTYEDITARLQLEEQLRHAQKMEAVGALAGGIAHDFKNLMMVVIGQAELARRSSGCGRHCEILNAIQQAAQRTAQLADKLLMLARRQITRPEVIDINELIRQLVPVVRRAVPENIELVLALGDSVAVRVDPSAFEQVILNLVLNGKDAMPDGGKLSIATRCVPLEPAHPDWSPDARAGEHVCLTISDTGVGMTHEVRSRAFEPFFTTKPVGKGTGLGLAIVYGAVKQAEGHLALETAPNRGSTFRIYLPRSEAVQRSFPAPPSRVQSHQREAVLVVEDEPQVRMLALEMLRSLGHSAVEASNGQEALRVASEQPDLTVLLTDFVMPILGGRDFIARFSEAYPHIRILCMSGYSGTADDIAHAHARGVRFLPKPFTLDELEAALALPTQRGATMGIG